MHLGVRTSWWTGGLAESAVEHEMRPTPNTADLRALGSARFCLFDYSFCQDANADLFSMAY